MTYNATLDRLTRTGAIERVEVDLDPGQQPERRLFVRPNVQSWFSKVKSNDFVSDFDDSLNLNQQLFLMLQSFISGEDEWLYGREYMTDLQLFKLLKPHENSIWELRTDDIRVFGWFVSESCFVACDAATAGDIKNWKGYGRQITRTVNDRVRFKLPTSQPT